jgi:hypothetical protein
MIQTHYLKSLLVCSVLVFSVGESHGQTIGLFEAYVSSQSIYHNKDDSISLEVTVRKNGGERNQEELQLYLLLYLEKDENEVLGIANDESLLDKKNLERPGFLDSLLEKNLVVVLDSKATKRTMSEPLESAKSWGKENQKVNAFDYEFQFSNSETFEQVSKLKNFGTKWTSENIEATYFMDRFRFLLFAPVNDSKYATKVSELAKKYDYSHGGILPARQNSVSTPILYFKSLNYTMQFRSLHRFPKKYEIYIN